MIELLLTTVMLEATVPPIVTEAPETKLAPLSVSVVPFERDEEGDTDDSVGAEDET